MPGVSFPYYDYVGMPAPGMCRMRFWISDFGACPPARRVRAFGPPSPCLLQHSRGVLHRHHLQAADLDAKL